MSATRRLPPLPAIRAFEAAARHLSLKAAADEICVTPSAISHQIRALEEFLGTPLFRREGNRTDLTWAGEQYLAGLTAILDELDICTRQAAGDAAASPMIVTCTPGFAARWLVPRLTRCPGYDWLEVEVADGAPSTNFARNGADVVVAWSVPSVPGAVVEPLMQSGRYPVCSPGFKARAGIRRPEDLLRQTLLHDEVMDAWDKWFRLAGMPDHRLPRGPRLPHCELTLTAAEQGQGVALAYDAMARGALHAGTLVRLFDVAVPPITLYSVAYPEAPRRRSRVRAFRDWIFAEVAAEGTLDRQNRILAAS